MRITPYFQALNLYHISKPLDLSNLEAQLAECRHGPGSPGRPPCAGAPLP